MRTELVSIPTPTLPLDGALHRPEGVPTRGGALLFHGNTMNFYTGAPRFLPRPSSCCVDQKLSASCLRTAMPTSRSQVAS